MVLFAVPVLFHEVVDDRATAELDGLVVQARFSRDEHTEGRRLSSLIAGVTVVELGGGDIDDRTVDHVPDVGHAGIFAAIFRATERGRAAESVGEQDAREPAVATEIGVATQPHEVATDATSLADGAIEIGAEIDHGL